MESQCELVMLSLSKRLLFGKVFNRLPHDITYNNTKATQSPPSRGGFRWGFEIRHQNMPLFTSRKQQGNIKLSFQDDMLLVEKPDGKQQVFPLTFYPALLGATEEDKQDWEQTTTGIRWKKLNVDINI